MQAVFFILLGGLLHYYYRHYCQYSRHHNYPSHDRPQGLSQHVLTMGQGSGAFVGVLVLHANHQWLTLGLVIAAALAVASLIALVDRRIYLEKNRSETLRQGEKRLRALVQNASDIITMVSGQGSMEYTSPSIQKILGHDASVWAGKTIVELVYPDDRPKAETFLRDTLSNPKTDVVTELRFQDADGAWRVFDVIAQNLLADSAVAKIVITFHDITRRKQREERLRLLESVVVHAHDSVLITEAEPINSPGPRILYVNEAFTRQTGYTLEEAKGKTPRILQGPKSDRPTLDKIRTALKNWQPIQVDILNYRKDGSEFWSDLSIVPVADETGWFTHWVSIQRDITDRKQAEQEIYNALEREKELRELKSRFVSMVSHEFRTPLATILASSDLLKSFEHKLSHEKRQERLNKIQTEVQTMTRLLDDILLIGKADAGRIDFNPAYLDLKLFCQDILDETRLLMSDRHTLAFTCQGKDFEVEADEKLLRHILTNLLSNAIKYSPRGGEINIRLQCEPMTIYFQVQDSGIGIPESDQARLFEPFHRASNVSNISGTGLGLSIIKYATELHGGCIRITSQEGVGSTFTISIPRFYQTADV